MPVKNESEQKEGSSNVKKGFISTIFRIFENHIVVWALYLLILMVLIFAFATSAQHGKFGTDIVQSVALTGCSGCIGAILYLMNYIAQNKNDAVIKKMQDYPLWFFFMPIAGIILGIFSYLFVASGLLVLSNVSGVEHKSLVFFCALAFLSGFSSKLFIRKLTSIAEAIFGEDENKPQKENEPEKEEKNVTNPYIPY